MRLKTQDNPQYQESPDPLRAAGLDYAGPIIADGVLHRFKANGDRNPNSYYTLHLDGVAAGSFGCWKRGVKNEHAPGVAYCRSCSGVCDR